MTNDYSLREIEELLTRVGYRIRPDQISVVLTRMRNDGLIEHVRFGYGPHPTIIRKPESALPLEPGPAAPTADAEPTAVSAAA